MLQRLANGHPQRLSGRHAITVTDKGKSYTLVVDLGEPLVPKAETLKSVFGLTKAEAAVAQHMATGKTVKEVARLTGAGANTVKTQLAAIFSKTHTRRQAQLVALLAKLALLP